MALLKNLSDSQIKLDLKGDYLKSIKQGRPWVYRDWLKATPPARAGSRAMLRDRDGDLIAFGMYDPDSPLAFRVCAVGRERLNDDLILSRLFDAYELRRAIFSSETTGYRLLNGEGDLLPGLVCDVYGDSAVVKLDGKGPEGFWDIDGLANWLSEHLRIRAVYNKNKVRGGERGSFLNGFSGSSRVEFLENGMRFSCDIESGQKTGFFLDQRDNRNLVRKYAQGKRVLNLFSYTGGFSVACGAGGAESVTSVDLSKGAVTDCGLNWEINNLPISSHSGVAADVFEFIAEARARNDQYDLVIVDPPSFAPGAKHVAGATESYERLFSLALGLVAQGGMIGLSSCSSHISQPVFFEICQRSLSKARKRAIVLANNGQPADHPFPASCSELQYLKFLLLKLF